MKKFLIINGPNLNMLGEREKSVYGDLSLQQIISYTEESLKSKNIVLEWFQSNIEGEIIDRIHQLHKEDFNGLVINPGGYSHTSVAIRDALSILTKPIVEVHLSNTNKREEFRKIKLTAQVANAVLEGLGKKAYLMGILSQID